MSLAGILTYAQVACFDAIIATVPEYEFVAPRYVIVPDHAEWSREWSRVILLVGAVDPLMDDCDCGDDGYVHVVYSAVRSDGMATDPITSGTLLESLIIPDDAWWDNALPVTQDMWPMPNVPDTIPGM